MTEATSVDVGAGVVVSSADVGEAGSLFTVYVAAAFGVVPLPAVIVNVLEPGVVGVPEIVPVVPSRVSPAGRAPELTVYVGAGDPVVVTVNVYGVPTFASVGDADVMVGATVSETTPAVGQPVGAVIVLDHH